MTDPRDTLIAQAIEMRRLQREYFRTRERDALDASKKAEREFDAAVREWMNPKAVGLFDA
jgi:hypothetical protein